MNNDESMKRLLSHRSPWAIGYTAEGRLQATRGTQIVTSLDWKGLTVAIDSALKWDEAVMASQMESANLKGHLDRLFVLVSSSRRVRQIIGAKSGEHFLVPVIEYFTALDNYLIKRTTGLEIQDDDFTAEDIDF